MRVESHVVLLRQRRGVHRNETSVDSAQERPEPFLEALARSHRLVRRQELFRRNVLSGHEPAAEVGDHVAQQGSLVARAKSTCLVLEGEEARGR